MEKSSNQAERGARSLLTREIDAHPALFSKMSRLRVRSAPMLLLSVCFASGILCRGWWQPPHAVALTCALLLLVSVVASRKAPRLLWPSVALLWVGLGWAAVLLEPSGYDPSLLRYADELQRSVDARVVAVHTLPQHEKPVEALQPLDARGDEENAFAAHDGLRAATQSLDLEVHSIEDPTPDVSRTVAVNGGARVTLLEHRGEAYAPLPCGARIRITLRLHPPQRYVDPGVWQYSDALAARGIAAESNADPATIHVLDAAHASWNCRFAAAQRWSTEHLQRLADHPALRALPAAMLLTQQDAAVLSAMLFGDRTQLDQGIRHAFERTGSFHLFVVAGMHVALLLAALYWLLLRLRLPGWVAAGTALTLTTAYAMLTGFGAPAQRALMMSAIYLLTQLLGRQRNALNALGSAALAMLILHPGALFEAGFQMTVLAVVAIAGIALPVAERTFLPYEQALRNIDLVRLDAYTRPRLAQFRVSSRWIGEALTNLLALDRKSRLAERLRAIPALVVRLLFKGFELLWITLCAEMVLALPMALYFHRLTPFATPANLLALPLVGLLMFCSVTAFVASLVHPALAALPAIATACVLHSITALVGTLSSLRGADVRMPAPVLTASLLAVAMWAAAVFLLRMPAMLAGRIACLLPPVACLIVLTPRRPDLQKGSLEFTAIDVGQGDALLAAAPFGNTMLIDAGGPTGSATLVEQSSFDIGEQVVSPYLWSRGIRRLDIAVLTHAHSDHIGGMAAVLRNFRPRELWVSTGVDTPPFHALLHEATELGITVRYLRAGDQQAWGGTKLAVLGPSANYVPHKLPTNDDSLILRIDYGHASVLAEGDAERLSESALTTTSTQRVTLLKVGHHGSNTSTNSNLLAVFHPKAAVISCGRGNRFGHPRLPVLQRLQAAGILTARTDVAGVVQYLLFPDGNLEIHTPGAQ